MNKILFGLAAVSALAVAAPAAAQYSDSWNQRGWADRGDSVERRLDQLRYRIDDGVRRGTISRGEAARLTDQLWRLRRLEEQYDNGGLSGWDRQELERRLFALRDEVNRAEGRRRGYGGYDRGGDWAWGDDRWDGRDNRGYDVDRPWDDQVYDRNDDGWDDRDRDRDGEWRDDQSYPGQTFPGQTYPGQTYPGQTYPGDGDDGYDPDDRYDPQGDYYENGAPIDPRAGDDWRDGDGYAAPGRGVALRIGERAPEGLSPVPPEYRSRYRDGDGVYYRYDDGRVYQIDQRTGTVRWVGELPY